ncbi:MAG: hypothetical protein ACK559_04735 [bacterium]
MQAIRMSTKSPPMLFKMLLTVADKLARRQSLSYARCKYPFHALVPLNISLPRSRTTCVAQQGTETVTWIDQRHIDVDVGHTAPFCTWHSHTPPLTHCIAQHTREAS